jgi:hypothetical protein
VDSGNATEESSFSEEKEAKRLLSMKIGWFRLSILNGKKFFGSFFQERTNLLLRAFPHDTSHDR